MQPPKKSPLKRSRPTNDQQPDSSQMKAVVEKGLDTHPDEHDPNSKKTRDFSVPLNEYYHQQLERIAEAMTQSIGVPVKRRPLAANAVKAFIDQKVQELKLDKKE